MLTPSAGDLSLPPTRPLGAKLLTPGVIFHFCPTPSSIISNVFILNSLFSGVIAPSISLPLTPEVPLHLWISTPYCMSNNFIKTFNKKFCVTFKEGLIQWVTRKYTFGYKIKKYIYCYIIIIYEVHVLHFLLLMLC